MVLSFGAETRSIYSSTDYILLLSQYLKIWKIKLYSVVEIIPGRCAYANSFLYICFGCPSFDAFKMDER